LCLNMGRGSKQRLNASEPLQQNVKPGSGSDQEYLAQRETVRLEATDLRGAKV